MAARAGALALSLLLPAALLPLVRGQNEILFNITEEEYFSMPSLFEMDDYTACLAARGVYCVGDFELTPLPHHQYGEQLYKTMQRYSANWVDNYNHTLLHRAACVSRRCPVPDEAPHTSTQHLHSWFESCINSSATPYGLSARSLSTQYCERGPRPAPAPLSPAGRALAALLAGLAALAAISTVLDVTLTDHHKKEFHWALTWSLVSSWRALQAPGPALPVLDGLRVLCMGCVLIEHVCWLAAQAYLANVSQFEQMRRDWEVMLMTNSTLVVQVFFLMSSFLLAHKLLEPGEGAQEPAHRTFWDTFINRIFRVSPSYFLVVWYAGWWWEGSGAGPLWRPLVGAEAAVCRRKWWTHLLYLNNVLYADDKCLIQTWYLAADMQLYLACLALLLAVRRWSAPARLGVLASLLLAAIAANFAMAYHWHLVPTFVMHRPELVRAVYSGESSFNVLYQSPLSNAAGALAGLLLAAGHLQLRRSQARPHQYKLFRWICTWAPYMSVVWAALSPRLLGAGPPPRLAAAALAAIERPMFSLFVALGVLGALHDVESPLRSVLSWRGWRVPARLSFGVLLLHMPFNKAHVASRLAPVQIDRETAFVETFGVAIISYLAALPLALLVEIPAMKLLRILQGHRPASAPKPNPDSHALTQTEKANS